MIPKITNWFKCLLWGHLPAKQMTIVSSMLRDIHATQIRVWACPRCHKIWGVVDPYDRDDRNE